MEQVNRIALLICAAANLVACSHSANPQKRNDLNAVPISKRIPPPDAIKYRSIQDARDCHNPYLLVGTGGIKFAAPNGFSGDLSPQQALAHLRHLPPAAWSYGLVVAVRENGVRASLDDDVPIKANLTELLRLLKQVGIKAELWPSA